MAKDLTVSSHDRQNILNNHYALRQAEQHLGFSSNMAIFNSRRSALAALMSVDSMMMLASSLASCLS